MTAQGLIVTRCTSQANLAGGWDVISHEEGQVSDELWRRLSMSPKAPEAAGGLSGFNSIPLALQFKMT